VVLTGRARDLQRRWDGTSVVVDESLLEVQVDWINGQRIRTIRTVPECPDAHQLVGVGARVGFRNTFAELLPERWGDGSTITLLFDELPITTSLSRHALIQNGSISLVPSDADPAALASRTPMHASGQPICAAWTPGGAYEQAVRSGGVPLLTEGLPAPSLINPADPDGWHDVPELEPGGFRRLRRFDVNPPTAAGGPVEIDSLLRDSYITDDREELVIHEYEVRIEVDPDSHVVLGADVRPRALPGPECPAAASSASRTVGLRLEELREHIRAEFVGVTTCTHLNDHLRAIGDTHRLLRWIGEASLRDQRSRSEGTASGSEEVLGA
jgi:Protein of unknown function (DUF2889)